jgi:tetratricopeptide (TPR) repeat protein
VCDSVSTLARGAAERALELDPDHAEAHAALGWVHYAFDWDTKAADRELRLAMELDPSNAQARAWHGCYVVALGLGRHDEGIAQCLEAIAGDPLSIGLHGQLGVAQALSGRFADAVQTSERALEQHPSAYLLWHHLGMARSGLGDHEGAKLALEHAVTLSSMNVWAKALLGATHALLGDREGAEDIQAELVHDAAAGYVSPTCLAMTATALGRLDEAYEHLEEAIAERDGLLRLLPIWKVLDPLREQARCGELLAAAGL